MSVHLRRIVAKKLPVEMEAAQAPILLRILFRRVRATAGQPDPTFQWLGQGVDPIRDQFNQAPPLALPDFVNNDLALDMETLVFLLDYFLHKQPRNTRGYGQQLRSMEA